MGRSNLWRPIDFIGCHLVGPSFVGGWHVGEVLHKGAELKKQGYKITYNLLGEHVKDPRIVCKAVETTGELLGRMDRSNRGNISIKPTLYGLEISREEFYKSAKSIIDRAKKASVEIEFDAEGRRDIPDTFCVFSEFASRLHYRGFVRQAVQAHLADIFNLIDEHELWDKNLRVVKGSGVYAENASVVVSDPQEVRERYFRIAEKNLENGRLPYLATMRDGAIIKGIKNLEAHGARKPDIQMLYGPLGRNLAEELLAEGWPVRIYIPFVVEWCKNEWKPYGMRRAATIRRLFFEDKEVRRAIFQEIKNKLMRR